MLDRYWHGGTSRISPEAPVPVVHIRDIEERLGGAGNVALNIASLGSYAAVIGLVGCDDNAKILALQLAQAGVESLLEPQANYPTITKLRVISRQQQLIRLDFEEGFEAVPTDIITRRTEEALAHVDVIVLSDYGKGVLKNARQLIDLAKAAGKPVLVDP
ncbi:MAG: D-beta-D-heptose 7-phosphate kinase / D-beta-D-heptose 1-phosphate adenosyltransferase, partial [Halothiobacillaceae bacterium]